MACAHPSEEHSRASVVQPASAAEERCGPDVVRSPGEALHGPAAQEPVSRRGFPAEHCWREHYLPERAGHSLDGLWLSLQRDGLQRDGLQRDDFPVYDLLQHDSPTDG